MINSGVARRAPRNARSCRGSASFPKPLGVPRGYAPLVAGHLKVSEKGRQRKRWKGEREAVPPPRAPRGDGCSEDGRGARHDRTPRHNFMIITEFRMLPHFTHFGFLFSIKAAIPSCPSSLTLRSAIIFAVYSFASSKLITGIL